MHTTNVASGILRSALVAGSLITITVVAACGLAIKGSDRFTVNRQLVTSTFTVSRLNQPVRISAPPASQLVISVSDARLPSASKVAASACDPAPPATASAAAVAYSQAVAASYPARRKLDETLTAQGFSTHRNDLITQVNADACSCLLMPSGGSVRLAGSPVEQA